MFYVPNVTAVQWVIIGKALWFIQPHSQSQWEWWYLCADCNKKRHPSVCCRHI